MSSEGLPISAGILHFMRYFAILVPPTIVLADQFLISNVAPAESGPGNDEAAKTWLVKRGSA